MLDIYVVSDGIEDLNVVIENITNSNTNYGDATEAEDMELKASLEDLKYTRTSSFILFTRNAVYSRTYKSSTASTSLSGNFNHLVEAFPSLEGRNTFSLKDVLTNNVSTTVQGTIKAFAFNVIQAFRPQIIKKYAQSDMGAVNQYCIMATQYTLILFSIIAIPFLFKTECILNLWLGIIPEHTVFFLRVVLIGTIFNLANNIVNIPIHACGRMKSFSLVTGSCFMISIPLMYFFLNLLNFNSRLTKA